MNVPHLALPEAEWPRYRVAVGGIDLDAAAFYGRANTQAADNNRQVSSQNRGAARQPIFPSSTPVS